MRALAVGVAVFALSVPCASKCPEAPHAAEARELANKADVIVHTNIDEAISELEQATQLDPTNHAIAWKLALAYVKKENWDKVDATLAKACALAPTFARYFALRGHALVQMTEHGHTPTADPKALLETAVSLDPRDADAHYDLAAVLLAQRDIQRALAHYTKAIEVAPDRVEHYAALGGVYFRLGYLDQAIAVAREGLTWADAGHARFDLLMLWGAVLDEQKSSEAIAKYSAAKAACGSCNERGQQLVFFTLGSALARSTPPQKVEATANLTTFTKIICKGGAAARYADQCMESQQLLMQMMTP